MAHVIDLARDNGLRAWVMPRLRIAWPALRLHLPACRPANPAPRMTRAEVERVFAADLISHTRSLRAAARQSR